MVPARILAADDDPVVRGVLEEALASFGYEAVVVGDGTSALAAARADPPDLILLDQRMPGMDGPSVLAALQADPGLRRIPVVFLTGEPHRVLGLPGVAAVMGKPFRLSGLEATLRSVLDAGPAR
jgi:CheY-like chemotaxis protein